jgi:hypothetical protein
MIKVSKKERVLWAILLVLHVLDCLWFAFTDYMDELKDWWLSHSESPFTVETALPNEVCEIYFQRCLQLDAQMKAAFKGG